MLASTASPGRRDRRPDAGRAGQQLARGQRPAAFARAQHGVALSGLRGTGSKDRDPAGGLVKRVAQAGPVGDVEVGVARLEHGCHDRVLFVAERERGRRAHLVRDRLELGHGDLAQSRAHPAGQLDQADPEAEPPVLAAHHQALVGERAEQAVDASTVR